MFTLSQLLVIVARACRGNLGSRADLEATLLGFCEQWAHADNWPDRAESFKDRHRNEIRLICNEQFPLHRQWTAQEILSREA